MENSTPVFFSLLGIAFSTKKLPIIYAMFPPKLYWDDVVKTHYVSYLVYRLLGKFITARTASISSHPCKSGHVTVVENCPGSVNWISSIVPNIAPAKHRPTLKTGPVAFSGAKLIAVIFEIGSKLFFAGRASKYKQWFFVPRNWSRVITSYKGVVFRKDSLFSHITNIDLQKLICQYNYASLSYS